MQDSPKICTMLPEGIFQTFLELWQVWCHVHFPEEHLPQHNQPLSREPNQEAWPNTSTEWQEILDHRNCSSFCMVRFSAAQSRCWSAVLWSATPRQKKLITSIPGKWAVSASVLVFLAVWQVATCGYAAVCVKGPVCVSLAEQVA